MCNLSFDCRNLSVLQATGFLPTPLAHGQLELGAQRVQLDAQVTHAVVASLLGLPARGERTQLLFAIRQVRAQLAQAILGGGVGPVGVGLRQVGLLHAQAIHTAAQLVDLDRRGIQLHA